MDFFGFGARRKRADLIDKLVDLHTEIEGKFREAQDDHYLFQQDAEMGDVDIADAEETAYHLLEKVFYWGRKLELIEDRIEALQND